MPPSYSQIHETEQQKQTLGKYLPVLTIDKVYDWIIQYRIHFKITRSRNSKLGDYRPLNKGKAHKITVNHDLNQYAFLITFVHEVAHLTAYEKYQNRVLPHGQEWKNEFKELLVPFMTKHIFPDDVLAALSEYIQNPAASSCSDAHLLRTLRKYDKKKSSLETILHVEDLPENATFLYREKIFKKGKLLRKRYQCTELSSKRSYLFSPLAEVSPAVIPDKKGQIKIF